MRWPIGIAVALALVVAVNLAVLWIAAVHPDAIEPSYTSEDR